MRTIEYEEALELLCEQANERPDNQVSCFYVNDNNEPECIIGHILIKKLDIQPTMFREFYLNGMKIKTLALHLENLGIKLTDEARELWTYAQTYQDQTYTWDEAVELALDKMEPEVLE